MKKTEKTKVVNHIHAAFDTWFEATYPEINVETADANVIYNMKLAFLAGGVAALSQVNEEEKESS